MSQEGKVFPRSFARAMPTAVRAEGIYIEDEEGKRYIDGCSGALISNLGHGVPEIVEALQQQLQTLTFAHPSRWRNKAAMEAAEEVASITPADMDYLWLVSGGSEAIESAVKLARQYYVERDGAGSAKHLTLARWNSYHGSTLGTLAVGGNMPRRRLFSPMFMEQPKVPTHYCYRCPYGLTYPTCGLRCATDVERAIKRIGPQYIASFVAEPVVGSSVGALNPPEEYWPMIREICNRYDILLVADEIMTGFGRTGEYFAVNHWDVIPDIIAVAKGMAAGYVPTGGIIVREAIADAIREGSGAFTHGHTYNGNPLSGTAVAAVVRYIKEHKLVANARSMGDLLGSRMERLRDHPLVGDVRGLGLMRGVELVADKETGEPFPASRKATWVAARTCAERGLMIYPGSGMVDGVAGDQFMIAPPLVVTEEEINEIMNRLEEGLDAARHELHR
ncbi:MAG: aspartate aminotransferase family protein [Synergistales bacterium]|nr:aspartate aminotransferase family protein [Synergistales bacterium]